jgi:hypothetical protein
MDFWPKRVPQTAKIGVWYVPFALLILTLYWTMPSTWRVHPRLSRPVSKKVPVFETIDTSVCLVGDCQAVYAPWPVARIVAPVSRAENVVTFVRRSNLKSDTFVIMTATVDMSHNRPKEQIEASLRIIEATISAKWPRARIITVSPWDIHRLAQINGFGDGWHLTDSGYNMLLAFYPDLYLRLPFESVPTEGKSLAKGEGFSAK